ncbi:hypothetical protein BWQ96_09274 [Gracilariopsis chorda]|uniref:Uncharacterized protein n=1 Tax=Gracilariopsis chorda TaxID=448386 RepID=A0A2V3IG07_9FLOR|nr:hypothetical protein BWQ96_09274 [Gracilariopsis chorda]|eukprot:PXF41007.1 hypothetical protein BWQ96_09274 [Gracilariopsis chorda]
MLYVDHYDLPSSSSVLPQNAFLLLFTVVRLQSMSEKRKRPSFDVKQEALFKLGVLVYGTFATSQINPETKKHWKAIDVAVHSNVSKAAVFGWKKQAKKTMGRHLSSWVAKKVSRITTFHHPDLEAAIAQYMRERMIYMRGEFLFRADVVCKAAL